jgi:hypothetical protein
MVAAARQKAQRFRQTAAIAARRPQIDFRDAAADRLALCPKPSCQPQPVGLHDTLALGRLGARLGELHRVRRRATTMERRALVAAPGAVIAREVRLKPIHAQHRPALITCGPFVWPARRARDVERTNSAAREVIDNVEPNGHGRSPSGDANSRRATSRSGSPARAARQVPTRAPQGVKPGAGTAILRDLPHPRDARLAITASQGG